MNYGTGAFHKIDKRDYVFGAIVPFAFNWNVGYETDTHYIKIKDQNGSSSCVAQSTAYIIEILTGIERSAHYVYPQIFLPTGGAYMREGMSVGSNQLVAFEKEYPSYPATEDNLRSKKNLKIKLDPIPDAYASVSANIDDVAKAIRDNKCVMLGVEGSNDGWHNPDVKFIRKDWGHAITGVSAIMRNGKKCIKFLNSWGSNWGDEGYGYLDEDYFKSGSVMAVFTYTENFYKPTLISNDEAMEYLIYNDNKLVQNGETGEIGIIKGREVLVTSAERAGLLALTHIIRNGGGGAVTKELWDAFPKKEF